MNEIAANAERILQELENASQGKYPPPKLIAVTKTHGTDKILQLQGTGISDIGENRAQEIVQKLPEIQNKFQIHMIGRLQSNKVKYIIDSVCMIHSLDRISLAEEISRQAVKHGKVMPVLVQVSPAGEEQKGGIPPEYVGEFIRQAAGMEGISVRGLMAVMPNVQDEEYLSGLFRDMRSLFEKARQDAPQNVNLTELSMGMSGDYLLAAKAGATMVRIGSAIFGKRDYNKPQEEAYGNI